MFGAISSGNNYDLGLWISQVLSLANIPFTARYQRPGEDGDQEEYLLPGGQLLLQEAQRRGQDQHSQETKSGLPKLTP